jgi:hypothetical protein
LNSSSFERFATMEEFPHVIWHFASRFAPPTTFVCLHSHGYHFAGDTAVNSYLFSMPRTIVLKPKPLMRETFGLEVETSRLVLMQAMGACELASSVRWRLC